MSWWYRGILGPKKHKMKIGNIPKNFQLYQVFIYNFLCQNIPILLFHILHTRRIYTYWSDSFDKYWSGDYRTV